MPKFKSLQICDDKPYYYYFKNIQLFLIVSEGMEAFTQKTNFKYSVLIMEF